ncbi:protein-cysteine N-palmitoyltransferase Rasp [Colias croceus]|uniref:protein-cysteine N-palmitoyltransferase Rasp n=1 Tax=Colias crocea TaxID=72248 RepID=UPI001E27D946|nr:protein-cysteine N-palmitoyltransferase Rasp [Colias croceus]
MKNKINSTELFLCFSIWISANIFSLYMLVKSQTEILELDSNLIYSLNDLQPGWNILARFKDVSDVEWSSWKYFLQTSWYYLIITFFVSELVRQYCPHLLKSWYILSSILFVSTYLGFKHMIIIIIQPIVYATVILLGGKKASIWVISLILLLSYNSLKYKFFFWRFLDHRDLQDEEVYLILFCMAWIELRCISYSIDFMDNKEKTSMTTKDFIDMLCYVLYLPLLYTGPIVIYEEFNKSFHGQNKRLHTKLSRFLPDAVIFLLYTVFLDFSFHYVYFYAMQADMELIRKLPTIALCGGGLWMGLEFHMKYVISYGTAASFARLDNIEPPPTPRCIARIHVYSQMWRHFDVGLYRFLVKYIYRPSFDILKKYLNLPNIICKLLASLETFIFIFMWHGIVWHIFMWTILNYTGITLEHFGKLISKHERYIWFKRVILRTEAMEARFIAILCTPLLALSAISNFYLFAGNDVGSLFFECFSQPSTLNSIILCVSLYSCCHVSMALEDVPSRTFLEKAVENDDKKQ